MKTLSLSKTAFAFSLYLCSLSYSFSQATVEPIEEPRKEVSKVTFLGVETSRVSDALRNHIDIPDGVGLTIDHVAEGSGAEKAGLQQYDILLNVDGQIIINQEQLSTLIRSKKAGDKVAVEVLRKGKQVKLKVELGEHEEAKHRIFGRNYDFPGPHGPPTFQQKNWNFDFNLEDFQERMNEFQEKAAEMGNKALQYIPEIIIEREAEDGSKRITSFGRGSNSATITKDGLVAKMDTINGEKHFSVREKESDEGVYIYEGKEPSEEELKSLPENVQAIIERLKSMKTWNWEKMDDVKNENIKVIINTGKDEASITAPKPTSNSNPSQDEV